jgi:hypothetical protein
VAAANRDESVCGCGSGSGSGPEIRAGAVSARVRRGAEAGIKAAGIVLQIGAPKCAICWTTYAGLLNASWFAVTNVNPLWLATSALVSILTLSVALRRTWQTRRYATVLCATVAWLLLIAGWCIDVPPVRYAGIALLSISFATDALALRIQRRPSRSTPIAPAVPPASCLARPPKTLTFAPSAPFEGEPKGEPAVLQQRRLTFAPSAPFEGESKCEPAVLHERRLTFAPSAPFEGESKCVPAVLHERRLTFAPSAPLEGEPKCEPAGLAPATPYVVGRRREQAQCLQQYPSTAALRCYAASGPAAPPRSGDTR